MPPRGFLKANPRAHPRPDPKPKTRGVAGPEGFWPQAHKHTSTPAHHTAPLIQHQHKCQRFALAFSLTKELMNTFSLYFFISRLIQFLEYV